MQRIGVASVSDTLRIGGVEWVKWLVRPSADRIEAYGTAGIRMRTRGDVLLIHYMDEDEARAIDRAVDP